MEHILSVTILSLDIEQTNWLGKPLMGQLDFQSASLPPTAPAGRQRQAVGQTQNGFGITHVAGFIQNNVKLVEHLEKCNLNTT